MTDSIKIFSATNVIITRVGDTGREKYLPSKVTITTVKSRDNKGWIVAKNHAGNSLNFNGIVPGGMPVKANRDDLSVWFGKVPSLSYVDKRGKPIPTLWCFRFSSEHDFECFYGLMLVLAKLGEQINRQEPHHLLEHVAKKTNNNYDASDDASATSDEGSVNLLLDDDTSHDADADDDDSNRSSPAAASSSSSYGSAESPVFAESQNIFASLALESSYGDASCFSPLVED